MREALVREVEKERIRAHIIAEELGRRRVLEEQVRNELRMERDMMAMRSNGGFPSQFMPVSLPPNHINRLEPRILHQQPVGLEERIVMSIADKHGHGVHTGFPVSPFQQFGELPKITGIAKPHPEDTKKAVIVLVSEGVFLHFVCIFHESLLYVFNYMHHLLILSQSSCVSC